MGFVCVPQVQSTPITTGWSLISAALLCPAPQLHSWDAGNSFYLIPPIDITASALGLRTIPSTFRHLTWNEFIIQRLT